MKVLKKLFAIFLLVLVIAAAALWMLAQAINPEVVKNYVSSQLSALTQQKTKVDGEISWQVFPFPGIKLTHVQIGDENSQANYSAQLENLLFNLKVTPLLRGKLVFNDLKVDGFKVYINPDVQPPSTTTVISKTPTTSETKTNLAEQFAIERFLLSHGQLVITQKNKIITLSNLQIGAEQFNLHQSSFPLQFKTTLEVIVAQTAQQLPSEKILKTHINFKGSTSLSADLFNDPLTALQTTPIDGELSLQNTRLRQLKIAKISAHTKTKSGTLLLNPLTFNLYNGESVGDLRYKFVNKNLVVNQTATNLDSTKLIADLFNKTLFTGHLDFSIHAHAKLQAANWPDNLAGKGSLTIKDGVIEPINLNNVIEETNNQIHNLLSGKKAEMAQLTELGQFNNPNFFKGGTPFNLLTIQYVLQNSNLESNSFVLQTEKLQLKGDGSLNLKENNLDSRLYATIAFLDRKIEKVQQLLGGSFPILIKGNLSSPSVTPDIQKISPILTKLWVTDTLTKPVKKIEETLKTILIKNKLPLI